MGGKKKPLVMSDLAARTAADGQWVENCVDGVGATEWLDMGGEKKPLVMGDLGCADGTWVRRTARTVVDGASATAWLEMGEKKKPLVMSERGCADGGGREKLVRRTARTAADGVLQRSGWKWVKRRSRW